MGTIQEEGLRKLAIVKWDDASGYTMEEMESVGSLLARPWAGLYRWKRTTWCWPPAFTMGKVTVHYTCLPFGMLTSVTVLPELALASLPSAKQPSQKCSPRLLLIVVDAVNLAKLVVDVTQASIAVRIVWVALL